ncbi:MAG TPA: chemotaxis protein CheC [Candidatus Omnitrophota bacterium]|nr:chemotaxis protein CheC [Candidatus Omnitrophota bacterium]HPN57438.1 chemotaxis protein CheC [Candidatus Omnitrophota bacterium]
MLNEPKINRAIKLVAKISIDKASQVFSKLIKTGARIEMEDAFLADITSITERVNRENTNVVGAFVDLTGEVNFKFLFHVPIQDSMLLADLMLRREVGTTKEFDVYAASAVQEIGNILASAISGVFSSDFSIDLHPTPPEVVNDYVGTVFQEFLVSAAPERNDILIMESCFHVIKNDIRCHMYLLPLGESEKVLSYIINTM